MLTITKKFTFCAAHKLPNHPGKCQNLHGHTWTLEVEIGGHIPAQRIQKTGMIMDFSDFEIIINELVLNRLDHKYLNDVIENPTCENLVNWIFDKLESLSPLRVRLYENETSWAERRLT